MLRKSVSSAAVLVALLVIPAGAQETETERGMPNRSFARFDLDSATVDGFWAELGTLMEKTDKEQAIAVGQQAKLDITAYESFARLVYGRDKWEAGLLIPYLDYSGNTTVDSLKTNISENGIGDLKLNGKFIPMRSDLIDLGVGALLVFPTGDDNDGLGEGEFGGMPYLTGSFNLAIAQVRGHLGGLFFTGSANGPQASDRLVYGADIHVQLGKYVSLRNEFAGEDFYDLSGPGETKTMSYLPGLDIRIPIGGLDLLVRPTGLIGITKVSPDWGIGGSFVIASPTMEAPSAAGGIFVE